MNPILPISSLDDKDIVQVPIADAPIRVKPSSASTIASYSITRPELEIPLPATQRFIYSLLQLEALHQASYDRSNAHFEKQMVAIRKVEQKDLEVFQKKLITEASSNRWSFIRDISSTILAVFTFQAGQSLIKDSHYLLGAALMGSSILSIANTAMQHTSLWKSVSDQLPLNEETKKSIPLVLSTLLTVITLATIPFGQLAQSHQQEEVLKIFTQIASSFSSIKIHRASEKNTEYNSSIFESQFLKDQIRRVIFQITQGIQIFNEQYLSSMKDAQQIVELNSRTVQRTLLV